MYQRSYLAVDPGEMTTTLVEIDDYGNKATTAGIQRLLRDNGYEISRVDGVPGRRTSRTLSQFLKDQELPASLPPDEQLTALEEAALKAIRDVGVTLCNRTDQDVWAALGRRRNGNWESRGWWTLTPDSCGQIFTESLISNDVSYYAIQKGGLDESGEAQADLSLRSLSAQPSQFCISDSRFSVIGREDCADLGYRIANFRPLPIDQDGVKIDLTGADFSTAGVAGLRR